MFQRQPTAEELAQGGFRPEDFDDDEPGATFWPENAEAVALFNRVQTQWRAGFSGLYALDYSAVYPLLDRLSLAPDTWDQLLDDIRVMESAAVKAMRET